MMSKVWSVLLGWLGTALLKLAVKLLNRAGQRTMFDVDTPMLTRLRWQIYVAKKIEEQRQKEKAGPPASS